MGLFNPDIFNPDIFNAEDAIILFNADLFNSDVFNTGEGLPPIIVPPIISGGMSASRSRELDRKEELAVIAKRNRLLILLACS